MGYLPTTLGWLSRYIFPGSTRVLNLTAYFQPEPKTTKRTLDVLASHFAYLGSKSKNRDDKKKSGGMGDDDYAGEYQTLMEQELFDYVLFEVSSPAKLYLYGN